jgi:ubiquilin
VSFFHDARYTHPLLSITKKLARLDVSFQTFVTSRSQLHQSPSRFIVAVPQDRKYLSNMADDAATTADDSQVSFNVKAANDQKHVLTMPTATTVADLKTKLSTPEYADIPTERQRLIYSGRVLKDTDTLGGVKIKDGNTIHLVKGAASNARQNPANQGTSSTGSASGTPTPQVPASIAAGTGNNPLAGLTGARYAGFHGLPGMDMFGADGGVSPPQPHPMPILITVDGRPA